MGWWWRRLWWWRKLWWRLWWRRQELQRWQGQKFRRLWWRSLWWRLWWRKQELRRWQGQRLVIAFGRQETTLPSPWHKGRCINNIAHTRYDLNVVQFLAGVYQPSKQLDVLRR